MSTLLTITETDPTPLLKDFAAFTEYLKKNGVYLTPSNAFINGRALYEINAEMSDPRPDTTPRTTQVFYPLLHLFYHLSLAGKLFQEALGDKHRQILKPTERLPLYEALKPAEKYFFLLETFWVDTDFKKLQSGWSGRLFPQEISWLMEALSDLTEGEAEETAERKARLSYNLLSLDYLILHFASFGFWDVVLEPPERGMSRRYVRPRSVDLTDVGMVLAPILANERDFLHWNLAARRQEIGEWNAEPGSPLEDEEGRREMKTFLRRGVGEPADRAVRPYRWTPGEPFFKPFAPLVAEGELERTLPREKRGFVDGVYRFKVALRPSLWRRIEVSADHTLLDLHFAIQKAYRFDSDHLYSFFMDGEIWSDDRFTSPYDEEGPHVDDIRIGDLGLSEGQRILYLFDYGDEWRFQVTLEEIEKEGRKPSRPKIVEEKGRAPRQY